MQKYTVKKQKTSTKVSLLQIKVYICATKSIIKYNYETKLCSC